MIQVYEGNGEVVPDEVVVYCRYAQRTGPWKHIPIGEVRYQVTCSNAVASIEQRDRLKARIGQSCRIRFQRVGEMDSHVARYSTSIKGTHVVDETIVGTILRTRITNQMLYIAFKA